MNPHADISSFTPGGHKAYVRPIDVKGQLGAWPVQRWKESLREGFSLSTSSLTSKGQQDAASNATKWDLSAPFAFSRRAVQSYLA